MPRNDTRRSVSYCVGFPIDLQAGRILLIQKKRGPPYIAGRLNGIGGRVEFKETPAYAMMREAIEEAALRTDVARPWQQFHMTMHERPDANHYVHFFTCDIQGLDTSRWSSQTDEVCECWSIPALEETMRREQDLPEAQRTRFVYNLGYLLPMALTWLRHPEHHYLEG